MRIFLLSNIAPNDRKYKLSKKETHYLHDVLRLENGKVFLTKDLNENYYNATLSGEFLFLSPSLNKEENLLDDLSPFNGDFFPLDVYVSTLKGKKNEIVSRALTEIGVRRITFMESKFTQKEEISSHEKERIESIVKEAVQQSGGRTPIFTFNVPFEKAIKNAEGRKLFFHQSAVKESKTLSSVCTKDIKAISIFVGPEGGFSEEECIAAEESGAYFVLLNTNILRSETAAIYVASSIQSLYQN